ncbi:MAG: DUF1653 domain-containing protein [Butyrivibrio sp.]|nr:DUF1653 domain-containing protein [Muribaculum sp.]MCM1553175.1 DUF1653 domain-containing protein [Butyrivibrio sp.]
MSFIPRPNEIYKHFKGDLYQITAVAQHTETGEQLVVYQALYGDFKTYARPMDMFLGEVDREKYPDAAQRYRFELQSDNPERQKERELDTQRRAAAGTEAEAGMDTADEEETEQLNLDPQVLEFLDADSYEQRLNILAGLHHRITDDMITTMAVACDIEVPDGETEARYASLKSCLLTLERYECNRLR